MSDDDPQSALREWRDHLFQPATLVTLVGIAAVLTLAGAFGTGALLRPLPRFVYWLGMAALTYSAGYLASDLVRRRLGARFARPALVALTALVTGAVVSLIVLLVNWIVFAWLPLGGEMVAFFATIFAVAGIISLVFDMLSHLFDAGTGPNATASPALPPILARLPVEKRGPLVALSVEDHYVRVQTGTGEEVVLMRLADAIRETGETAGMQVHRSHWIATGAVTAARRNGDGAILTLTTGAEVPVSRRYVAAILEAGLLPRSSNG